MAGSLKRSSPEQVREWRRRSKPLKRGRKKESAAHKRARLAFEKLVLAREPKCVRAYDDDHECDGPLDPHHVIRKQRMKNNLPPMSEAKRLRIIFDPRVGTTVCRYGLHGNLTTDQDYLRANEVREDTIEFARDHDWLRLLEREVPEFKREFVDHG